MISEIISFYEAGVTGFLREPMYADTIMQPLLTACEFAGKSP